jgi:hypothetical protein
MTGQAVQPNQPERAEQAEHEAQQAEQQYIQAMEELRLALLAQQAAEQRAEQAEREAVEAQQVADLVAHVRRMISGVEQAEQAEQAEPQAPEWVEPANPHDIILSSNAAEVEEEINRRIAGASIARPASAGSESNTDDEYDGHRLLSYNGESSDINGEFDHMIRCGLLHDWTAELTRLIAELPAAEDARDITRQIRHARRSIIWINEGREIEPPRRRIPIRPFPVMAAADL